MLTLIIAASIKMSFVALPLSLVLVAVERAFRAPEYTGWAYMAYAGFATVAGLGLFPWAINLADLNAVALALALLAMALWPVLNLWLRRPERVRHAALPVAAPAATAFRHRSAPIRPIRPSHPRSAPAEMPFLPTAARA